MGEKLLRIFTVGLVTALFLPLGTGTAFATDGNLDTTFGTGGKTTVIIPDAGAFQVQAQAVQVLSTGKLLVGGFIQNAGASGNDFLLMRFNGNGTLDTTFGGGDGIVVQDFGGHEGSDASGGDGKVALAVQSDGKILLAGPADTTIGVARFNADGSLDTSYGSSGIARVDFGGTASYAGMGLLPSGEVEVGGFVSPSDVWGVARLTTAGVLDTSFSGDGMATASVTGYPKAMAVTPGGKAVLVGISSNGTDDDFIVARFTDSGVLDTTFSGDGMATVDFGTGSEDHATAVSVRSDGAVLVGGWGGAGQSVEKFSLARFTNAGNLDTSFSSDGKQQTGGWIVNGNYSHLFGLAIQPDGKIVAAGYMFPNAGDDAKFAVARYLSNGSLDTSFSGDGRQLVQFDTGQDEAFAVVVETNGRIVLAGSKVDANFTQYKIALAGLTGSSGPSCTQYGNGSANTLTGTAGFDVLCGAGGNDILHGAAGNDNLEGSAGNDSLYGEAGNDHLFGGDGNDHLDGGLGTDVCNGGTGTNTFVSCP